MFESGPVAMTLPTLEAVLWVRIVAAMVVLLLAWIGARIFRRAVNRFLLSRHLADSDSGAVTRFRMIARLGMAVIYFLGAGLALYVVNVSFFRQVAVAMFASAGVVGIAIGFASQTTAANLVSGILIAFAQPLRIGDRVEVDLEQGVVEEIGLLYTSIRAWDNRVVLIPNQFLSTRVIRNYTLNDPRTMAAVTFTVNHGADLDRVRAILLEEALSQPLHLDDPAPTVDVMAVDGGGTTVRLLAWAEDKPRSNDLAAAIRERALPRLAEAGAIGGGDASAAIPSNNRAQPNPGA